MASGTASSHDRDETGVLRERIRRLEADNRRLTSHLKQMGHPAMVYSPDGRVQFANTGAAAILGTTPEALVGCTIHTLFPRDADTYLERISLAVETGRDARYADEVALGDRTHRYTSLYRPLRDESGTIDAVQIVSIDTTGHFNRRQRLRGQAEYFAAIHDIALRLLQRHDVEDLLVEIVSRAGELAGTPDGFIYLVDDGGASMTLRVGTGTYGEQLVGYRLERSQGLSGRIWETDAPLRVDDYAVWENRCPDAIYDHLHAIFGVPIRSGGDMAGVIGLGRFREPGAPFTDQDVEAMTRLSELAGIALDNARLYTRLTEELRQREAAETALKRTSAALEISNRIATVFLTASGADLFNRVLGIVMESLESPYGYFGYIDDNGDLVTPSLTDNIGDACRVGDKRIVFARSDWSGIWGQSLIEKRPIWANEGLTPPPGHVPLSAALACPVLYHGQTIGQFTVANRRAGYSDADAAHLSRIADRVAPVLSAWRDRRRLEKDKSDLESQLRQLQKIEAIGTLAGGIAHDFNNILFPIVGLTEMALEDVAPESALHRNLKEVMAAAQRAKHLVRQILDFSARSEREVQAVPIADAVEEAINLARATLPATIDIRRTIDGGCGMVMADPTHIHQVAMNLVTNAFHAMQEAGGVLTVHLSVVTVGEDAEGHLPAGRYACLQVSDTGVGMDDAILARIFDPYFSTKGKDKGTGLGLAVVHGIVHSYRGDIRVTSTPGEGTTFEVYLPQLPQASGAAATPAAEGTTAGSERILVIDDEPANVMLLTRMLERNGYQVEAFTDPGEALNAMTATPGAFDLVLTDMTMPGMTGDRLAEAVKRLRKDIPVIVCTGFSERLSADSAEAIGIAKVLVKPLVMQELNAAVRGVLDR